MAAKWPACEKYWFVYDNVQPNRVALNCHFAKEYCFVLSVLAGNSRAFLSYASSTTINLGLLAISYVCITMSVDLFNKDCPDYEKPYRKKQRAQLLVTQISFKHEQPLIWHAAKTLFTRFADTKEAKDICYRYTGTKDTARLAGLMLRVCHMVFGANDISQACSEQISGLPR